MGGTPVIDNGGISAFFVSRQASQGTRSVIVKRDNARYAGFLASVKAPVVDRDGMQGVFREWDLE